MRAAKRGTGLRLSADEVFQLSGDDAVSRIAANDDCDPKAVKRISGEYEPGLCDVCDTGKKLMPARYHGLDCPRRARRYKRGMSKR